MKILEELVLTFGFKEGPFIIAILCIMVLLGNFMGGLISNIMLAMRDSPIVKRSLIQRTSFRLAITYEFSFILYIVYYHTALTSGIVMAQGIYWMYFVLAAPLLAMLGAQTSYLIYAKKIDRLKSEEYATEWEQESEGMDADSDDYDDDEEATPETSTPEANPGEIKGYRQ